LCTVLLALPLWTGDIGGRNVEDQKANWFVRCLTRGAELGSATHARNGRVRDVIPNVDVLVQVADTDVF
jgi:hypothetical protein